MKKGVVYLFLIFSIGVLSVGCSNEKPSIKYTIDIDDIGDTVVLEFNTSDKYEVYIDDNPEIPIEIWQDGYKESEVLFIGKENFEEGYEAIDTEEKTTMIDSGEKDGNEYMFWVFYDKEDNYKEYNYSILVDDSSTAVLICNTISEESARDCFNELTITLDN